jgi:hypothetical protein
MQRGPVDFCLYTHPVMAVSCPDCGAKPGRFCKRPSGHKAMDFHKARKTSADAVFIQEHGDYASIENTPRGWVVDPTGRIRPNTTDKSK